MRSDASGLLLLLAAGVLAAVAACGDSEPTEPSARVTTVDVTPTSARLTALGDTQRFEATARDGDGRAVTAVDPAWSVTPDSVARVDASGRVVAGAGGEAEVRAAVSGVTGSATLTVAPSVAELRLDADSLRFGAIGDTGSLGAEPRDANGNALSGRPVTWRSSDTAVAAVDSAGRVTARGNGTARVRAEAAGAADTATVVVDQEVAALSVSPDSASLRALGDTGRFEAEVSDPNGRAVAGAEVAWTSSDTSVVAVDSGGRAVARSNGTARVRAAAGGVADTAAVLVDQRVAAVSVGPDSVSVHALGDTADLDAGAADANGHPVAGAAVAWSSSDTAVAAVDSAGRVVARSNGVARIAAEAGGGADSAGGAAADTGVVVVDQRVASVSVSPGSASLDALGDTVDFDAGAADANGHAVAGADVAWSSSNADVAAVDSAGRAVARGAGRAAIRAEAGGATDEADVTLWASDLTVDPGADTVTVGDTADFGATARDADGNRLDGAELTWRSRAPDVATVDDAGRAAGQSEGEAGIEASARGGAADAGALVVEAEEEEPDDPEPEPDPNLEAVELDVRPTGVLTDGTTTAELIVRNEGGAADEYAWEITEDGTGLASGTRSDPPAVDTVAVPGLGPFAEGVHELTLTVDPDDAVSETDEGDNTARTPLDSRTSGFSIETQLVGEVSGSVSSELPGAVSRWESAITGDLREFDPDVLAGDSLDLETCFGGEESIEDRTAPVDDLLVLVREDSIDGEGGTLGFAGPCWFRTPADAGGDLARMPLVGEVTMDSADADIGEDLMEVVLAHEIGHALGLVFGPDVDGGSGPGRYTGAAGVARYRAIGGTEPTPPMDAGSSHWEEETFGDELMTPFVAPTSPMSEVTIGALADRSYAVDYSAGGGFTLGDIAADALARRVAVGDDVRLPERIRVVDPASGEIRLLRDVGGGDRPW